MVSAGSVLRSSGYWHQSDAGETDVGGMELYETLTGSKTIKYIYRKRWQDPKHKQSNNFHRMSSGSFYVLSFLSYAGVLISWSLGSC